MKGLVQIENASSTEAGLGRGRLRHITQSEDRQGRPFSAQMLTQYYVLVPVLGAYHMAEVQL